MSVGALLLRSAASAKERTAVVYNGRRIRYSELHKRVQQVANALIGGGCRPGDRVALLLENRPEFIELYAGCAVAGMTVVPLNPKLHERELQLLLGHAEPALLVCGEGAGDLAAEAARWVPGMRTLTLGDAYETWVGNARAARPVHDRGDAPLAIAYTSGTTGLPKGVVISHRNALASIVNGMVAFGLHAGTTNVLFQPLVFHALFVGHILGPLAVGAQICLMPQFDPEQYLDLVAAERANFLVHVPTTIRRVLEEQQRRPRDLSSVETLFTGGAPCPGSLHEQVLEHVPRIIQGYGLTEATNIVACTSGRQPASHNHCGSTLPSAQLAIEDGQIVVKGDVVMQGYWRDEAATDAVIRDGWLQTGDLGEIDAYGQLRVTGRMKDVIISGGVKVYSNEVEDVLLRHPAVAEAAVVGVPDPEWGEAVQAWVVLRAHESATADSIRAHCENNLARFKRPRYISFSESLPKNANGKIRKDVLRQMARGG